MIEKTGARKIARAAEEAGTLSQSAQHVVNFLKAGFSGIPVIGGPIATLMSDYIPTLKQQKLEWFIEDLAAEVGRISHEIDADKVHTDEFAFIYEKCLRGVSANIHTSKLKAFRAILLNSLRKNDVTFDEKDFFLTRVNQFSHVHLRILSLMRNPEAFQAAHRPSMKPHPATYLDYIALSVGTNSSIIRAAMRDLEMNGYFRHDLGFLNTGMDDQLINNHLKNALSPDAHKFVAFCMLEHDA